MFTKRDLFAVHSVWLVATVFLVVGNLPCRADTLIWINASGGDWNNQNNWTNIDAPTYYCSCNDPESPDYDPDNCDCPVPDVLPGPNDDVFITMDGTYTVTLASGAEVNSLTLGGTSGTQTLLFTGDVLRLNADNFINAHGVLTLIGHLGSSYPGGSLTVDGAIDWHSGQLALQGPIIITTNGSLTLTNDGVHDFFTTIYNSGVVRVPGATILRANAYNGSAYFINQTNGLVDITGDGGLAGVFGSYERIYNQGLVRRSGGTGNMNLSVMLLNYGTLDIQTGSVNLDWPNSVIITAEGNGTFKIPAGNTLQFSSDYILDDGAVLSGAGTNLFLGSSLYMSGTRASVSNLVFNGGTMEISNSVFSGRCSWPGGDLTQRGAMTIMPGASLRVSVGGTRDFIQGVLTNAGTIELTNITYLRCFGAYGGGKFFNLTNGVVDLQDDSRLTSYTFPSEAMFNDGTIRKSGGNGLSFIFSQSYHQSGLLDVQRGQVQMVGPDFVTGCRLNFGLNSPTDYGQLILTSGGPLDGITFSANLNNGFVPVAGNSFTNVYGTGISGVFSNTLLPSVVAWETNYPSGFFILNVVELVPPTVDTASYADGQFALQISGISGIGWNYIISASTNLTQWTDLFTNPSANTPFQYTDTNAGSFPNRFYRVRLSQ